MPSYELPSLLRAEHGIPVTSAEEWQRLRRPELLQHFRDSVYGHFDAPAAVHVVPVVSNVASGGGAFRRTELDVRIAAVDDGRRATTVRVLVLTPAVGTRPFPVFLGLNLFGNQTIHAAPELRCAQGWLPENPELGLFGNRSTEESRGMEASRFSVEMLTARGYALVTAYAGDFAPDSAQEYQQGVYHLLSPERRAAANAPGVIATWAFGLSRLLDVVERLPILDAARVAIFGHSRLGKCALWAAAQDTRFAIAISNQSGCGGAALSRRRFGERLLHINQRFPHWFCRAFHEFDEREQELPVDQHQLLALLAPRPLYVASAAGDLWADPRGERLACEAAAPAYELFGLPGLKARSRGDTPAIGYHQRPGRHDITPRDFWHYLDFTDRHFGVDSLGA